MLFQILSITHGWFEVDFNRQFVLTNSDFMGCDAPALLLDALGNLFECKATVQWLCWQDEPGAYILRLERDGEQLSIEIFDADKDSYHLDYSGANLERHIVKILYKTDDNIKNLIEAVTTEFSLYENGNGQQRYRHHWGDFPQKQYDRLRLLLRAK